MVCLKMCYFTLSYSVLYRKIVRYGWRCQHKLTNLAEVIDLANPTGALTALPPMQESRSCQALADGGSRVFAFGGINEDGETSSCEFYDSRTNR